VVINGSPSLAAVDLGSNSFHMVVARAADGHPVIIDRLRDQVRLAAGLDDSNRLSKRARRRALECLGRFGQRIRDIPSDGVRAVATNTLRVARNARSFLKRASEALGHPIEVISGREEARLIYLGVSHTLNEELGCRLVLDIGGGSTECILGERFEPLVIDSLEMGCVTWSRRFFRGGYIEADAYEAAVTAARLEVRNVARRLRGHSWTSVVGASGTMRAIATALRENGWAEETSGITRGGLRKLGKHICDTAHVEDLALIGVKDERAWVFPGGVAIAAALAKELKLAAIEPAAGALREGVLFDLLGRLQHEDARDRTIKIFQDRYQVDIDQSARVERTAIDFLGQVHDDWELDAVRAERFLSWAARLHEIGIALAFEGHHRHAAYIVANADMPGFSRDEVEILSALIGVQRRKIRIGLFGHLAPADQTFVQRLAVLMRLSIRFNRDRAFEGLPEIRLKARSQGLELRLPPEWLDAHPLTRADLEAESDRIRSLGLRLRIKG